MARESKDHALAQELDDERREVPEGWVRAFDRSSGHHFYAPSTAGSPDLSTWTHPYDNPSFLQSLPADHPANPRSAQAEEAQRKASEERAKSEDHPTGSAAPKQGLLGKLFGSGGEEGASHEERTAIRAAEEAFRFRQDALNRGDLSATGIKSRYAPDPYAYPAPSEPFSRPTASGVEYAYGYPGGYGRRYTPEHGYDKMARDRNKMTTAFDSLLQGANVPVSGHSKKTNYGFHG